MPNVPNVAYIILPQYLVSSFFWCPYYDLDSFKAHSGIGAIKLRFKYF